LRHRWEDNIKTNIRVDTYGDVIRTDSVVSFCDEGDKFYRDLRLSRRLRFKSRSSGL